MQQRRHRPAILRRRGRQLILGAYAVLIVASIALVIGPWLNDREINQNTGRALATVTDIDWLRTTVDFQDESGLYHSPETGLLYPSGLGEGQRVWVSYSTADPELVKVEGREWTLSVIPALSVWAVSTAAAAVLWWLLNRATRGVNKN